jgi:hypothetical protein
VLAILWRSTRPRHLVNYTKSINMTSHEYMYAMEEKAMP